MIRLFSRSICFARVNSQYYNKIKYSKGKSRPEAYKKIRILTKKIQKKNL